MHDVTIGLLLAAAISLGGAAIAHILRRRLRARTPYLSAFLGVVSAILMLASLPLFAAAYSSTREISAGNYASLTATFLLRAESRPVIRRALSDGKITNAERHDILTSHPGYSPEAMREILSTVSNTIQNFEDN